MIDHSHLTHGCRPGRYREHDPRDRIYKVIRDLESSVSPVSKGLFSLFIKRNSHCLSNASLFQRHQKNFWGIFKKKIRVKHKRRNIVAVIQFFLVGMLFHCRSWAKIFGIVSLCYVKLVLFSFLPLMNQVTFSLGTTENRWNLSFISYVGIIFYHKSHRYSLYVRPKALHSVRDQLSGGRWR